MRYGVDDHVTAAFRESSASSGDSLRKMKRFALILAAAASVAASMPLAAPAFARPDDDQGRGRAERSDGRGRGGPERGGERRGDGPRGGENRGDGRGVRGWERIEPPSRYPDERPRYAEPPPRYEQRPRYEGRPSYDEPPPRPSYVQQPSRPNYMQGPRSSEAQGPRPNYMRPTPGVRRGYVPDSYRGDVVEDYRRYRLRPPPQGYAWVRMGNGFALVEMGSGRIFDRVD